MTQDRPSYWYVPHDPEDLVLGLQELLQEPKTVLNIDSARVEFGQIHEVTTRPWVFDTPQQGPTYRYTPGEYGAILKDTPENREELLKLLWQTLYARALASHTVLWRVVPTWESHTDFMTDIAYVRLRCRVAFSCERYEVEQ